MYVEIEEWGISVHLVLGIYENSIFGNIKNFKSSIFSFLDSFIPLICLAMAQIRGKDTH